MIQKTVLAGCAVIKEVETMIRQMKVLVTR
jgi:hypothetical protein